VARREPVTSLAGQALRKVGAACEAADPLLQFVKDLALGQV
jgi:hypothetical protein